MYTHAKSCLIPCDPTDCSLPGSSVHAVLQARTLEWVAMPSSRGSSWPGIKPEPLMSPELAGGFFTSSANWEATVGGIFASNFEHASSCFEPCKPLLCNVTHTMILEDRWAGFKGRRHKLKRIPVSNQRADSQSSAVLARLTKS